MTERKTTAAVALALAALVAWSFWLRWQVLAGSPFPVGVDGYYYPVQVRALLEHGALAYPASPLAFWWMAPFTALTDPITGAKLGAALGGALVALPAYGLGARLGRGRAAGLLAAAVASCCATSTYLSLEFVKQGLGLTVALAALWLVLRALERATRRRIVAAATGVIAVLLAHKLAAALVVVVAVPAAIEEARRRGALRGRRLFYALGGVIALVVAIAIAGAVWPQRFASLADLHLAAGLLTADAQPAAPALVRPWLAFGYEPVIGGVLALAAIAALVLGSEGARGERVVAWAAAVLGVVIALPWLDATDPQGLAFRLRVAAFVPLALNAAVVAGSLRPLARRLLDERAAAVAAPAVVLAIAALFALVPRDRREGLVVAHPALVASALALSEHVPAGATVIVSERHVEYMVAWYTRAPVSLRPEPVPYASRVRVLLPMSPVHGGFSLEPALDEARREPLLDPPLGLHPRNRDGFVLVTEATWDWILTRLPARTRRHWAAWHTI